MNTQPLPLSDDEARIIARHFMIAACWADCDEGTHPRPTNAALKTAEQCAREFVEAIGLPLFRATLDAYESAGLHPDCYGEPCAAFGHDLYLTLSGHGCGFWDRDALNVAEDREDLPEGFGKTLGDTLTDACHASPWRDPHGSGRLEFWRGWVYFRHP